MSNKMTNQISISKFFNKHNNRGMTIVEITIAMLCSTIVIFGALALLGIGVNQSSVSKAESELNDELLRLTKFFDIYIGNATSITLPVLATNGGASADHISSAKIDEDLYFAKTGYCDGNTFQIMEVETESAINPSMPRPANPVAAPMICSGIDLTSGDFPSITNIQHKGCKRKIGVFFTEPKRTSSNIVDIPGQIIIKDLTNPGSPIEINKSITTQKFGITKFAVAFTNSPNQAGTSVTVKNSISIRIEGKVSLTQNPSAANPISFCPYELGATPPSQIPLNNYQGSGYIKSIIQNISLRNISMRGLQFGKTTEKTCIKSGVTINPAGSDASIACCSGFSLDGITCASFTTCLRTGANSSGRAASCCSGQADTGGLCLP